jgi:hypothetical protein
MYDIWLSKGWEMRNVCYVIVSCMRDEECMLCDCLKDERWGMYVVWLSKVWEMRNVCYVIVSRMRDEECMLCDCLKVISHPWDNHIPYIPHLSSLSQSHNTHSSSLILETITYHTFLISQPWDNHIAYIPHPWDNHIPYIPHLSSLRQSHNIHSSSLILQTIT